MLFRFLNVKEINSLIKKLKNNKPSGVINLRIDILKDALKIQIIEFKSIINECLDKSYVPSAWKRGVITPVSKITPCHYPIDYRPISVLIATSKVLERAVHDQLIYYLESNGILDHRQHGYRKDHSTLSAVYKVTQYLYNNMDCGKITYCAFIDYSKPFDTLDHDLLMQKLRTIGLSYSVIDWCISYI